MKVLTGKKFNSETLQKRDQMRYSAASLQNTEHIPAKNCNILDSAETLVTSVVDLHMGAQGVHPPLQKKNPDSLANFKQVH